MKKIHYLLFIFAVCFIAVFFGYLLSEKAILSFLNSFESKKEYGMLLSMMRTSRLLGILIAIPGYGVVACMALAIKLSLARNK